MLCAAYLLRDQGTLPLEHEMFVYYSSAGFDRFADGSSEKSSGVP